MRALYGWGSNALGQLGQGPHVLTVSEPVHIRAADAIVGVNGSQAIIQAGSETVVVGEPCPDLRKEGGAQVLPIGKDEVVAWLVDGQLWKGRVPCGPARWRDAAADVAGRIGAILDDTGVAWRFASLDAWAAWDGTECEGAYPLLDVYERPVRCLSIYAGGAHFVALADPASNDPHQLYTTGDNRFGQLGDDHVLLHTRRWHAVDFFSASEAFPAVLDQVACGHWHTLVRTTDGDCYLWGQLPDRPHGTIAPPTLVELQVDIAQIACGALHCLFLSEEGTVLACGNSGYILLIR